MMVGYERAMGERSMPVTPPQDAFRRDCRQSILESFRQCLREARSHTRLLVLEIDKGIRPRLRLGAQECGPFLDVRRGVVLASWPQVTKVGGGDPGCREVLGLGDTQCGVAF